ncbi:hypothetical protein ANCCEY_09015 [Ancylostoma ceylanicum]|uniref:Uncharacterized protein n=1 Tax=Ancylostoma ceylanicum TaxID=53326 RepID=A0A0D6LIL8_9BILA|nr:hypothetical protein ANCCEY_09015 [Ancylostoma ceylanicum]
MRTAAVQHGLVHKGPNADALYSATDLWRSYFAQKLLHMVGETVAFYPANAIQTRDFHYFDDIRSEE